MDAQVHKAALDALSRVDDVLEIINLALSGESDDVALSEAQASVIDTCNTLKAFVNSACRAVRMKALCKACEKNFVQPGEMICRDCGDFY